MERIMRKVLTAVLAAAMFFTAMPVCAAEGTVQTYIVSDSITAALSSDGVLKISGTGAIPNYTDTEKAPWKNDAASIKSIQVGSGITGIGEQAFSALSSVTFVTLANTIEKIGRAAFSSCRSITALTMPASLQTIGSGAFYQCSSLVSLNLDGDLNTIGDYFIQGSGLKEITIPASVTSISPLAFAYSGLQSIAVENGSASYMSLNGVLYSKDGGKLLCYPADKAGDDFSCAGLAEIGEDAFIGVRNLKTVDLSSVSSIGANAFLGSALTAAVIPDSVTKVGNFTFYGCTSLQSVQFGSGLTDTAYEMFYGCSSLASVDFGKGLQKLNSQTFARCTSLKEISLPAGITEIGNGCFAGCTALASFESAALEVIPYQAFLNDTALASVSLNEGLVRIENQAFGGCTALAAAVIPKSVMFIHEYAFPLTTVFTLLNPSLAPYGAHGYKAVDYLGISGYRDYTKACEVLSLVNRERTSAGKSELKMEESLLESAMQRAAETVILFSHGRPNGDQCFSINSKMSAENIACGSSTAEGVMEQWMNSSGHKANILGDYSSVGIGCFQYEGTCYWVQCFSTDSAEADCSQPADADTTAYIDIPSNEITDSYTEQTVSYSFSVSPSEDTLTAGSSLDLTLYLNAVKLVNGENSVYWKSSDDSVASVSGSGKLTAKKAGVCTISASSKYLERKSFTLRVTENERIFGDDRYGTSFKTADRLKSILGISRFSTVILASGADYPDALSGSYLASVKNAPILLTDQDHESAVETYVKNNLAAGGKVYILGGEGAVSKDIESALAAYSVKRLGGETRYDTNLEILKESGAKKMDMMVCSGDNFPDALSVSSVGRPVFLTGESLSSTQKAYLSGFAAVKLYIAGGTGAVSQNIEDSLKAYAPVERLGGETRIETSVKIAETFFPEVAHAVLVYSQNFPDGISGGPVAFALKAPVLLVAGDTEGNKPVRGYILSKGVFTSLTFGGTSLISDDAVASVMGQQ
jgi:putative cell wall-binding protein